MFRAPHSGNRLSRVQGRGWLCLLLVLSFLFNPFLASSPTSSIGTTVSRMPSFRATVASSELLKFAPKEKVAESSVSDCDVASDCGLTEPLADASAQLFEVEGPAAALYSPIDVVWFRPPPVA